jgi:hypothetical protein
MQGRPLECERRVDYGLDVGGAGIAITVPCMLGQRTCHLTPPCVEQPRLRASEARPLFVLIAVRWGTRKDILHFFAHGVALSH